MTSHLRQSRILKALTDNSELDFSEAGQRLSAARVAIVVADSGLTSAAGQACALTAVNAGARTFGRVTLVASLDAPLKRPMPGALTLRDAARALGAEVTATVPDGATHCVLVGPKSEPVGGFAVRCWWNGWLAGVHPASQGHEEDDGWNPLAGVFAGALAIREIFAQIRGKRAIARLSKVSLWEPWESATNANGGPTTVHLPRALMLLGLGHLGQGFLWGLAMLPARGEHIVLQDGQHAGEENEATGLVTRGADIGRRKTRVAADWIEHFGWDTQLVERMFLSGTKVCDSDPSLVVSALDSPTPRRHLLEAGYPYMIDIGVGHGPADFESGQLRTLARGDKPKWSHLPPAKDTDSLLQRAAYQAMSASDKCGAFNLASASVAVPFVGAALGALAVAQCLRLGAMHALNRLVQIELAAPDMPSSSGMMPAPAANIGTIAVDLIQGTSAA